MIFQFDMSPTSFPAPQSPPPANDVPDLLRQMVDLQKEQLGYLRALLGAHDATARWKAFVAKYKNDFGALPDACKTALPHLERSYGQLLRDLTEHLNDNDDPLDNDFALQEFLDRYGIRLAQLGTLLNMVGPFAEAGSPSEST